MDGGAGEAPGIDRSNRTTQVLATHIVFPTVSLIFFALRVFTRKRIVRALGWDDVLLGFGWTLACANDIIIMNQTRYGLGRHVLNVTPDEFRGFLKLMYGCVLVYISAGLFIKSSLLLFYTRLKQEKHFRYTAYSLMALNVAIWIACTVPAAFGCRPLAAYWDKDLLGYCIKHEKLYLANGIMNVITDFATLTLPIPIIWGSPGMPLQKRLKFTILFALGGIVCIAGIVRVPKVQISFGDFIHADATWRAVESDMWSQLEQHLAITTASIPAIRPLFHKARDYVLARPTHTTEATWQETHKSYPGVTGSQRKSYSNKYGTRMGTVDDGGKAVGAEVGKTQAGVYDRIVNSSTAELRHE